LKRNGLQIGGKGIEIFLMNLVVEILKKENK
jgi:hypothetical protein